MDVWRLLPCARTSGVRSAPEALNRTTHSGAAWRLLMADSCSLMTTVCLAMRLPTSTAVATVLSSVCNPRTISNRVFCLGFVKRIPTQRGAR